MIVCWSPGYRLTNSYDWPANLLIQFQEYNLRLDTLLIHLKNSRGIFMQSIATVRRASSIDDRILQAHKGRLDLAIALRRMAHPDFGIVDRTVGTED